MSGILAESRALRQESLANRYNWPGATATTVTGPTNGKPANAGIRRRSIITEAHGRTRRIAAREPLPPLP
jgi:hypothetical protein